LKKPDEAERLPGSVPLKPGFSSIPTKKHQTPYPGAGAVKADSTESLLLREQIFKKMMNKKYF
jgi:hypothetical protein